MTEATSEKWAALEMLAVRLQSEILQIQKRDPDSALRQIRERGFVVGSIPGLRRALGSAYDLAVRIDDGTRELCTTGDEK